LTPNKINESDEETLQTTARHTATEEPAGSDIVRSWLVHPQGGLDIQCPFGKEIVIKGGNRLGLVVTAAVAVNAVAEIGFEE